MTTMAVDIFTMKHALYQNKVGIYMLEENMKFLFSIVASSAMLLSSSAIAGSSDTKVPSCPVVHILTSQLGKELDKTPLKILAWARLIIKFPQNGT